jgi:hypothetical protein
MAFTHVWNDERDVMSPDATASIDMSRLPSHVAQAVELRRTLVTASKMAESCWQDWATAKQHCLEVARQRAGQGRAKDAMDDRRAARLRERETHERFTRWETQSQALGTAWATIRNTLTRREGAWVYMMCAENLTQHDHYQRIVLNIDAQERIAQVPAASHAYLSSEFGRYGGGRVYHLNVLGVEHTFSDKGEVKAFARDQALLVTMSDYTGSWIVFDFVDGGAQ